ncbi:MAG TPA: alpha/beta fold hydrolase [Thermodesulfobacteriota bacterium]|nr:alpha/beta fold hydrolase [Thermodesulfobacteriota bacterium]
MKASQAYIPVRKSAFLVVLFLLIQICNFNLLTPSAFADIAHLPAELKEFWSNRLSDLKTVKPEFELGNREKKGKIVGRGVWFRGYGNVKLHGYLAEPANIKANQKLPAVLLLHGYSDYGRPSWAKRYARMGFIALAIDVRGHGKSQQDYNPGFPGLMVDNITNPEKYSLVGVILDAIRGVDFLETLPEADRNRIYVSGSSMGGGSAMIVSALDGRVRAVAAGVPFLNNIPESLKIADGGPYMEVKKYLKEHPHDKEKIWETLKYIDAYNYAPYINKPIIIGVGLADSICPPEGIKSTFELIPQQTKKEIYEVPKKDHVVLPAWHEKNKKWFSEN